MRSQTAAEFCKSGMCPTADALLSFHLGELPGAKNNKIEAHLGDCDFCHAELHLLAAFPPGDEREEKFAASEMPAPLRELAQVLLGGTQSEFRFLDELINGKEILALKSL